MHLTMSIAHPYTWRHSWCRPLRTSGRGGASLMCNMCNSHCKLTYSLKLSLSASHIILANNFTLQAKLAYKTWNMREIKLRKENLELASTRNWAVPPPSQLLGIHIWKQPDLDKKKGWTSAIWTRSCPSSSRPHQYEERPRSTLGVWFGPGAHYC